MSQLSLFLEDKPKDNLYYKVRLTNIYRHSTEDHIYTYANEHDAYKKLDQWVNFANGNSGVVYREKLSSLYPLESLDKLA
jgi:hypothetical protein